jgi:hypothetical protein
MKKKVGKKQGEGVGVLNMTPTYRMFVVFNQH